MATKTKTNTKQATTKVKETAKKVQQDVLESAHKVWLAGLGALSTVGEEGDRLFRDLVEKGKKLEKKGKKEAKDVRKDVESRVDDVKGRVEEGMKGARVKVEKGFDTVWSAVDERVGDVLNRLGVPTRDEIHRLTKRVEDLNAKIDGLRGGGAKKGASAAKSAKPASNGRMVYHVVPDGEDWKVEREGSARAASVHDTKDVAVNAGRELAKSKLPAALVVHRKDGTVQNRFDYDVEDAG